METMDPNSNSFYANTGINTHTYANVNPNHSVTQLSSNSVNPSANLSANDTGNHSVNHITVDHSANVTANTTINANHTANLPANTTNQLPLPLPDSSTNPNYKSSDIFSESSDTRWPLQASIFNSDPTERSLFTVSDAQQPYPLSSSTAPVARPVPPASSSPAGYGKLSPRRSVFSLDSKPRYNPARLYNTRVIDPLPPYSKTNPYLDSATTERSSPSWRHLQQQAYLNPDWPYTGYGGSSYGAATEYGHHHQADRAMLHPVFCGSDYVNQLPPYLDQNPRASLNYAAAAAAQAPPPSSFATEPHAWGADPLRFVGKSQSMRALYEENAALRRALYSMRRGASMDPLSHGVAAGELKMEPERYIASDVAEGRTLSMRERGRWAAMAAQAAVGDIPCYGHSHNCQLMQAMAHQQQQSFHDRGSQSARHQLNPPSTWWDQGEQQNPSSYWMYDNDADSVGTPAWLAELKAETLERKPSSNNNNNSNHHHHSNQNKEGFSLKQLFTQTEAGTGDGTATSPGAVTAEKLWSSRRGQKVNGSSNNNKKAGHNANSNVRKKTAAADANGNGTVNVSRNGNGVINSLSGRKAEASDEEFCIDENQCAMCGGKLRHVDLPSPSSKKLGLPLRLCPACHPRAAASLPPCTTRSPPLSAPHVRHRLVTAISMACKPAPTAGGHGGAGIGNAADACAAKKKSKARFVDLCRHFVGLSTKS